MAMSTDREQRAGSLEGDEQILESLLFAAIAEHDDDDIARTVGRLHRLAGRARDRGQRPTALRRAVAELDPDLTGKVAKALLLRLQLADFCEERERIRRLRRSRARRASLDEACDLIAADGPALDEADRVQVEIVLTMHPSDATRRAVLHKMFLLADRMDALERAPGTASQTRIFGELEEAIGAWWATDEVRRHRPPVEEEIRRTVFLVETGLYDAAADVAILLEQRIGRPLEGTPLRFVQWAGGDMDGNPSASAATLRFAVREARRSCLELLLDRVVHASRLHSETSRYADSSALRRSIARDARELPRGMAEQDSYRHEPLRRKLRLVRDRLTWTLRALDEEVPPDWTYRSQAHLVEDIAVVRAAAPGTTPSLNRLYWQARIFGIHLLSTDIRLHATEIGDTVDTLLPELGALDPAARTDALRRAISQRSPRPAADAPSSLRAAHALDEAARLVALYGPEAIRSLVISGCESPADVYGAVWLLRRSGLDRIPVVPLFESGASLTGAAALVEEMLAAPGFRRHVRRSGDRLEVMLGHSDGGKEDGFLAAQWRIWRAQEEIARVCAEQRVAFRPFHGRGGSPARGAAPPDEIARAIPPRAATSGLRVTEQGEAARSKLAHPVLARRTLEQLLSGALLAALRDPVDEAAGTWATEMEHLAATSRAAWRDLLDDPAFVETFVATTPIGWVDDLNLGSRPARRAQADPASLRAIPWVMAWTQTRVLLPAWYGAGSALGAGDLPRLQAMWRRWPPFRAMISSLEAALFRTDLSFVDGYLDLHRTPDAVRIWNAVIAEHERTREAVLAITGEEILYERRPELRDRLRHRNPWIDPLSALQTRLLADLEAGRTEARQPLLTTMAGIAAGIQNVG